MLLFADLFTLVPAAVIAPEEAFTFDIALKFFLTRAVLELAFLITPLRCDLLLLM